jgi:hypothetical protein
MPSRSAATTVIPGCAATLRGNRVLDNGGVFGSPGWNSECANDHDRWEAEDASCVVLGGDGHLVETHVSDGCWNCLSFEGYPGSAEGIRHSTVRDGTFRRCRRTGILVDCRVTHDACEDFTIEDNTIAVVGAGGDPGRAGIGIFGNARNGRVTGNRISPLPGTPAIRLYPYRKGDRAVAPVGWHLQGNVFGVPPGTASPINICATCRDIVVDLSP